MNSVSVCVTLRVIGNNERGSRGSWGRQAVISGTLIRFSTPPKPDIIFIYYFLMANLNGIRERGELWRRLKLGGEVLRALFMERRMASWWHVSKVMIVDKRHVSYSIMPAGDCWKELGLGKEWFYFSLICHFKISLFSCLSFSGCYCVYLFHFEYTSHFTEQILIKCFPL